MENKKCEYGCGLEAKYQLKNGNWCCEVSSNKCIEVRKKNSNKIKERHKENKAYKFTKEARNKSRLVYEENFDNLPFEKKSWNRKKKVVLEEQKGKCLICGFDEWLGQKLVLQLDHIDGDHNNNKRENFRVLCPNCHSLTPTYKKGYEGKFKRTEEEIIFILKTSKSLNEALKKCDVSWASVGRVKRIKEKHKIKLIGE